MGQARWAAIAAVLAALAAPFTYSQQPSEPAALVKQYCLSCHNDRTKVGELTLETLDAAHPESALETWEKVIRKVRVGMMPPQTAPQPTAEQRAALITYLESELDRYAATNPNPGAVGWHRLNRAEYANAIRDLLDLRVDAAALLPPDDAAFGFDNIAETLGASPALVEQYLTAAGKIAALAVGDPETGPAAEVLRIRQDSSQNQAIEGMPAGTTGGGKFHINLPLDGEYKLDVKYIISNLGAMKGLELEHEIEISVDGQRVHHAVIGGRDDFNELMRNIADGLRAAETRSSTRVKLTAGPHDIAIGWVYRGAEQGSVRLQPALRATQDNLDATGHPHIETLTVTGPFNPTGPGDTPSRRRIFTCRPKNAADEPACAKTILSRLVHRAYRGMDTPKDLDRLLGFFASVRPKSFERGIQTALERLLASPKFTFRIERDPANLAPGERHRLTNLELAARLSFFLWSSIPDDALLAADLAKSAVLEAQVRRMLADPKARALTENFAGQWLYLRNIEGFQPASTTFLDFDDNLRQAMKRETELFFASIVEEDRNVLDLMTADYTFLNERLARHYRIPRVYGAHFRRVTLKDEARWGLLGKASTLMVSSHTDRTSPVVRGKWVLENLLGAAPPPPPADVPTFNESNQRQGRVLTMRERMEEHRANPVCASCHRLMDPIGLSLENFDAVGAWRDREAGGQSAAIDAAGTLLDGTQVNGPVELRKALLKKPDLFVSTLTEKLMVYALGRGLSAHDMPEVRRIVRESSNQDYRFSALILGVATSQPFQWRMKPPAN